MLHSLGLTFSVINLLAWNHITANTNTQKRYKRATIKDYFSNVESLSKEHKTPPSKAPSLMKFLLINTKRQGKDVFQLTCSDTKELSKMSLRYAGILLEYRPKKKPFSALVGLDEDKDILWNKDLKWDEIYGNKLFASGKTTNSERGVGKLTLVIPNDKCYNQYGTIRCKIYTYAEAKNNEKVYRQVQQDMPFPSNVDCDENSPPIKPQNNTEHKTKRKPKDGAQIDTPPSPKHEESDDAVVFIFLSIILLALVAGCVLVWHRKKTKQKEIEAKKKAEAELETAKKRQSSKKKAKKLRSNKKTSSLQTDYNKSQVSTLDSHQSRASRCTVNQNPSDQLYPLDSQQSRASRNTVTQNSRNHLFPLDSYQSTASRNTVNQRPGDYWE
ncbi:uncharacterized protein LOC134705121 [Mytilus trossulus]|uniref:uncharacterized protein LOC134705121 n=1 Tax=Mytilus trossulus TaxID=6551 RepID=UPI003007EB9E